MNVLLDTNAYTAYKRERPEALEIVQRASLIGLDSIVWGELLSGFVLGTREERNRRELESFCSVPRVQRFSIDGQTAEHYAAIFRHLRVQGRMIPTNDIWIAASALQHGFMLFSYDGHFQDIPGLVVGSRLNDLLL